MQTVKVFAVISFDSYYPEGDNTRYLTSDRDDAAAYVAANTSDLHRDHVEIVTLLLTVPDAEAFLRSLRPEDY